MHRWKLSALAAAAFVSSALTPTDASALALGTIAVQSALGEPLRAEIAVPQVTAAELEALRASIATPDIFRAQGMEYTQAARQIQVEVVRNADGTAKLRLTSHGPVTDPFVDLVVDANWSSGHLVRSYTLLLDPPAVQRPAPAPVTAPQTTASAKPATPRPANVTGRDYSSDGATPAAATSPAKESARGGSVTVRSGDTAGRLASAHRPAGVSLDQMLVAMQRNNPGAFVNGNVNRLRAGSVVKMPSKDEATSTSVSEARQIVAAQSRDFNEFRRRLATKVPDAKVAAAERSSSGQVQAQVQDNAASAPAADKLTLSKGALKNQHAAEEKLAQDKQASAQTDRMGELQRNLDELKKVAASSSTTSAPTASTTTAPTAAPAPAAAATPAKPETATGLPLPVAVPAPLATTPPADAAPAVTTAAPAPTEATTTAAAPSLPASPPVVEPAKPVAPSPAPAPAAAESGFLEELTGDNPLVLPAAGGALALLLGLIGWRTLQRRRQTAAPAVPAEGSLGATEGFFDDSGGQQIDTRQSTASGAQSTMAYSPSQLDAGGDVDPVAEAEVYLAYGRDVQAEEILKEALRTQPDRLGVHMKLAEIYAKRHDAKSFQATANAVELLTNSTGPNWERILELGRTADPANTQYQQGTPNQAPSTSSFAEALAKSHASPAAPLAAAGVAAAAAAPSLSRFPADLDLNLDMDLPGGLAENVAADIAGPASVLMPSDQDFAALEPNWNSAPAQAAPVPTSPAFNPAPAPAPVAAAADLAHNAHAHAPLDLNTLEFGLDDGLSAKPAIPLQPLPVDEGFSLDLGDLNLELGDTPAPAAAVIADDPLATKLDLAREFHAIGDSEGARTLVEEVIAEASGDLKARAQNLLAEIN